MRNLGANGKKSTMKLTTTGRKSGKPRTVTVWFALDDEGRILVQHVRGDEANWYRNLLVHPQVEVDFGQGPLRAHAAPILDRDGINRVLAKIRRKYLLAWLLQAFGRKKAVAAVIELL